MSTDVGSDILCIAAHPDDVELMAGGSVAKWIDDGCSVHVLTLSDGVWEAPDGTPMRGRDEAAEEEQRAAACLGYTFENLAYPATRLAFDDRLVCEVLARIGTRSCDMIVCPWERDLHHDHEVASRVAVAASRRVPRVLMGQINPYLRDVFTPNVFVDISETWERKLTALKCYASQWRRVGNEWSGFLDAATRHYGHMVGVARAEGFVCNKLLL